MVVIDILVYIILGAGLSWLFYYSKRKDLLGGYTGGVIVGILGAVLGVFLIKEPIRWILDFLQSGLYISNVDVLAGVMGGYAALFIFNKINHDRTRKDY